MTESAVLPERTVISEVHFICVFQCQGLCIQTTGKGHCCKVSDEAAFCLIQRPYISKTLLTRRISPRGSP
ncbi:hypothetical protein GIB25_25420 [Escherichia coli]|nr:hypothetical protein [Escherichia coli]